MELLPEELILHIASYLTAADILPLNLVSKRFHQVSRDNELWKNLCLQGSIQSSLGFRDQQERHEGSAPTQEPSVYALQRAIGRATGSVSSAEQNNDRKRAGPGAKNIAGHGFTSQSVSHASQDIDWYEEYVARHAPLSLGWLSSPCDVRGMGLLQRDKHTFLVTPMENGSVCVRDMGQSTDRPDSKAGQIIGCSEAGILFNNNSEGQNSSQHQISGGGYAVDCVSIDQFNQRLYFAGHSIVTEVDLSTLQPLSRRSFDDQICSLSDGGLHPNPLTVGTTKSVHIYDPRDPSPRPSLSSSTSLAEGLTSATSAQSDPYPDLLRLYSSDRSPTRRGGRFASIDPLPLSIVHLSHDIHVGGRFPSILSYDRRFFPRKMTSFYSGARISALIPFMSPGDCHESLVAAGEYKSKGSLEIYPLTANNGSANSSPDPIRNRVTASSSKLLSVIRHGTRILFSDSNGQLKWVESDGYSLVRRWNINQWSVSATQEAHSSVFHASADEGDVARKLLALDEGERSEILIWTGEKIGVLGYGNTSRFPQPAGKGQEGSGSGSEDEGTTSGDEEKFNRMMRRALERQANEVRFVQGLGLGG